MLAITNSVSIEIKNIAFIGCGKILTGTSFRNRNTTAAAIAFYNVSSVAVLECIFLNSYGHGIVGLNVASNFTIRKVKFIQNATATTNGRVQVFKGGILLYNRKLETTSDCTILIRQCYFSGIQNMWTSLLNNSTSGIDKDVNSAVLGVVSYQRNASIKIEILKTRIDKITSKDGALIYSYILESRRFSMHITSCNFSYNRVINNSIISIKRINSLNYRFYFHHQVTHT